ncbi:MAG: hypothetical protein JO236_11540 [Mycobacterium sp.]|uniref:hypothetical protein n=1 Tax=Mycobacterium sp. TaxID=1785 RepID=UPI001ECAFCC1|nr:hypothetical protein [Mycobacterium sp.]MBW0018161.1 hypothetical protein [Mycobacterium sp.]
MIEQIAISEIQLSPLADHRATGHIDGTVKVALRLTMRNIGDDRLFATSAITTVGYSDADRVLCIGFQDYEALAASERRRPFVVRFITVEPHSQSTIDTALTSSLTFGALPEDDGPPSKRVCLYCDVDTIEITVTYADQQPPIQMNLASGRQESGRGWRSTHTRLSVHD